MANPILDANNKDVTVYSAQNANAPTVANPGIADPTGTTNLTAFGSSVVSDGYLAFQITTAGTETTGALRVITLNKPLDIVRPAVAAITTVAGVAAGGTVTVTVTPTTITISVGTALTTATIYNVYVRLL